MIEDRAPPERVIRGLRPGPSRSSVPSARPSGRIDTGRPHAAVFFHVHRRRNLARVFPRPLDPVPPINFQGPPLRRVVFDLASVVAVIGGAAALPSAASAHHTIEAIYDLSREIETTATFERVDWINPHVWMRFDIQHTDGRIEQNVLVETLDVAGLRKIGIDKTTLHPGSVYGITYHPTRSGSPGGYLTSVTLDGTLTRIVTPTRSDS